MDDRLHQAADRLVEILEQSPTSRHAVGFEVPKAWRAWVVLSIWFTASASGSVLVHPHHLDL